ncbi:MAG: formylglycine-generating enzyme family protein [Opitutaceae bacterium]|jgi:formylglycine-generating enzyme required for sulfatase activity|nr:formylglycine-generating enzyme family protein [Opitutaceae bacterium]
MDTQTRNHRTRTAALLATLTLATAAAAATAPGQTTGASILESLGIGMQLVPVGDAGNAADPATGGNYGAVGYDYHIGTYEVTNAQYVAFLNAVARESDPYGLYSGGGGSSGFYNQAGIERDGSPGNYTYRVANYRESRPVAYVSFWDAARFVNWLGTGDTETGVYNLGSVATPANSAIARDPTAWENGAFAIANENEWYKAAYYNGDGTWRTYPTTGDLSLDRANYDSHLSQRFDTVDEDAFDLVGGARSFYGTYHQGGNVWEWNETITGGSGVRGGSHNDYDLGDLDFFGPGVWVDHGGGTLAAAVHYDKSPTYEFEYVGFRVTVLYVTAVPEPAAYAPFAGLAMLAVSLWTRRGKLARRTHPAPPPPAVPPRSARRTGAFFGHLLALGACLALPGPEAAAQDYGDPAYWTGTENDDVGSSQKWTGNVAYGYPDYDYDADAVINNGTTAYLRTATAVGKNTRPVSLTVGSSTGATGDGSATLVIDTDVIFYYWLRIGDNAGGTLRINQGKTVNIWELYGDVGDVYVGYGSTGTGHLILQDGAKLDASGEFFVGNTNAGTTGTITVERGQSTIVSAYNFEVHAGSTLELEAGATLGITGFTTTQTGAHINGGATLVFDGAEAIAGTTVFIDITGGALDLGTLTTDTKLNVELNNLAAGAYELIHAAGGIGYSGDTGITAGNIADYITLTGDSAGELNVYIEGNSLWVGVTVAVPEPAGYATLAGLALLAWVAWVAMRRSRGAHGAHG